MRKRQEGITTLILLMLLSVVSIFIIMLIQSKIILSLRRGFSSGDTILSSYISEAEINDVLARIVGEYENVDNLEDYLREFPDGSVLEVEFKNLPTLQTIIATTRRPYAVSKIKAERAISQSQGSGEVEIVLILDCTGSMNSLARSGGTTTRLTEEKRATLAFVDAIRNLPDADRFYVGVVVFGARADWYKDESLTVDFKPESGYVNLTNLYNEIDAGFRPLREDSRCSRIVPATTNTGSGVRLANNYFDYSPHVNAGKVEVVITDGLPNAREVEDKCPISVKCSSCKAEARDFLRCELTPQDLTYVSEVTGSTYNGVKDMSIETYAVTVLANSTDDNFLKTVAIFSNTDWVKRYFNSADATRLTEILESFLEEIIEESSVITIQRVIPGTNLPN